MCVDCIVNGKTVDTQGELLKLMPKGFLFENGYELIIRPDTCLCPVDFEATAKLNGMNVVWHKWDDTHSGEVELTNAA